jgi:hypothetical protein
VYVYVINKEALCPSSKHIVINIPSAYDDDNDGDEDNSKLCSQFSFTNRAFVLIIVKF